MMFSYKPANKVVLFIFFKILTQPKKEKRKRKKEKQQVEKEKQSQEEYRKSEKQFIITVFYLFL